MKYETLKDLFSTFSVDNVLFIVIVLDVKI